ncbi:hypothetical protein CAOG_02021 [Capsaspora owczarzaki ATCC 30864]|uniref:PH domain-containing protein n=1 Tax=Capsaspora owczarzaki (strain ATCC 30864) TaxID=595528 RepID=A0A0D2VL05_CAPO3|nr:hypothetical protein CAOG_02021 [Capsaspora owczarzaki ATCC 30864]KJE90767.1 hypothetical protein CAOG_002021 [Capsaspora owczarzaki ATCC 30864]|eukprot:XP_004348771.1 hypothetical protein CAOG_02021 [Capsaspora owczarzaki ATCC 30864]
MSRWHLPASAASPGSDDPAAASSPSAPEPGVSSAVATLSTGAKQPSSWRLPSVSRLRSVFESSPPSPTAAAAAQSSPSSSSSSSSPSSSPAGVGSSRIARAALQRSTVDVTAANRRSAAISTSTSFTPGASAASAASTSASTSASSAASATSPASPVDAVTGSTAATTERDTSSSSNGSSNGSTHSEAVEVQVEVEVEVKVAPVADASQAHDETKRQSKTADADEPAAATAAAAANEQIGDNLYDVLRAADAAAAQSPPAQGHGGKDERDSATDANGGGNSASAVKQDAQVDGEATQIVNSDNDTYTQPNKQNRQQAAEQPDDTYTVLTPPAPHPIAQADNEEVASMRSELAALRLEVQSVHLLKREITELHSTASSLREYVVRLREQYKADMAAVRASFSNTATDDGQVYAVAQPSIRSPVDRASDSVDFSMHVYEASSSVSQTNGSAIYLTNARAPRESIAEVNNLLDEIERRVEVPIAPSVQSAAGLAKPAPALFGQANSMGVPTISANTSSFAALNAFASPAALAAQPNALGLSGNAVDEQTLAAPAAPPPALRSNPSLRQTRISPAQQLNIMDPEELRQQQLKQAQRIHSIRELHMSVSGPALNGIFSGSLARNNAKPENGIAIKVTGDTDDASVEPVAERVTSVIPTTTTSTTFVNEVHKTGYMTKQGGANKNWKRRWFVLTETQLKYFKTSDCIIDDDSDLLGQIDLNEISCVESATNKRSFCFKLVTPDRTYFISCESDAEAAEWMSAISLCMQSTRQSNVEAFKEAVYAEPDAAGPEIVLSDAGVVVKGYLTKQGGGIKSWKKRWFVLGKESLENVLYYKDDKERELMGGIRLTDCTGPDAVYLGAVDRFQNNFPFEIRTSKRIYYLAASNAKELDVWFSAFRDALTVLLLQRRLISPTLEGDTSGDDLDEQHNLADARKSIRGPPSPLMPSLSPSSTSSLPALPAQTPLVDLLDGTETDDAMMLKLSRSAYLSKKGGGHSVGTSKGWKRRWFVLREQQFPQRVMQLLHHNQYLKTPVIDVFGLLFYYRTDKEKELMGVIDLAECSGVSEAKSKGHEFVFQIVTADRTYLLSAESEQSRRDWIQLLSTIRLQVKGHRERHQLSSAGKEPEVAGTISAGRIGTSTKAIPQLHPATAGARPTSPAPVSPTSPPALQQAGNPFPESPEPEPLASQRANVAHSDTEDEEDGAYATIPNLSQFSRDRSVSADSEGAMDSQSP